MGDQAEISAGPLWCPLQQAGWSRQIRTVRSIEQLNAGGMLLLDVDVIRVLEETLPHTSAGGRSTTSFSNRSTAMAGEHCASSSIPVSAPLIHRPWWMPSWRR